MKRVRAVVVPTSGLSEYPEINRLGKGSEVTNEKAPARSLFDLLWISNMASAVVMKSSWTKSIEKSSM